MSLTPSLTPSLSDDFKPYTSLEKVWCPTNVSVSCYPEVNGVGFLMSETFLSNLSSSMFV